MPVHARGFQKGVDQKALIDARRRLVDFRNPPLEAMESHIWFSVGRADTIASQLCVNEELPEDEDSDDDGSDGEPAEDLPDPHVESQFKYVDEYDGMKPLKSKKKSTSEEETDEGPSSFEEEAATHSPVEVISIGDSSSSSGADEEPPPRPSLQRPASPQAKRIISSTCQATSTDDFLRRTLFKM